jgi:uncharacterized protein YbaR (Trm112 family)/plasmid stabilization system protein ParE
MMDARLIGRHIEGDPDATHTLERALRVHAAMMLEHPAFRMDDALARGVHIRAAATEALARGGRDGDELLARVVIAAALHGIEHLRALEPMAGTGHLPPAIIVSYGVAPHAMAGPALAAAELHLIACPACKTQARLVREAGARAVQAARAEEAGEAMEPEDVPSAPLLEEEDALEEAARQALEHPPRGGPWPAGARLRPARKPSDRDASFTHLAWGLVLLFLVALGVAVLATRWGRGPDAPEGADPSLAVLARIPALPIPPVRERSPDHAVAFQDAEAGRCIQAATRFRKVRRGNPFDVKAWYWEGLSFLCAGKGPEAVEALSGAARLPRAVLLTDLDYYRGQAALVVGDRAAATAALDTACATASPLSATACEQAARLR